MIENNMRISVRNLIEFIYRQGDIDDRIGGIASAQEGTRLHKVIQKELKEQCDESEEKTYINEMYLSRELCYKEINIILEGRADGVIISSQEGSNTRVKIIEIKTTMKDLLTLEENENFLHWAQGKLYGHIYCEEENLSEIDIDLIYCHRESLHTKTFSKTFLREELKEFFNEVMGRYTRWIHLQSSWIELRNNSIEKLDFPFKNYRKGQRELAINIELLKRKKIFTLKHLRGQEKLFQQFFLQ